MDKKTIQTISQAQDDFGFFVRKIFSQSRSLFSQKFIGGEYIGEICRMMQENNWTARVSAKDHFKSASLYAHFMWQMIRHWDEDIEGHYFSYQNAMAAYHIGKIKMAVKSNPYFEEIIDKKGTAESVIAYSWDGRHAITLEPHGLLEFKRGIHAPLIYVDDPFQDPANKLVITIIKKINEIFVSQILDMTQKEIHVCGTPQTTEDFFFSREIMGRFKTMVSPAITNWNEKKLVWPERYSWEELMAKRAERGEKIFNREYLCSPVYAEEAFIRRQALYELVNPQLKNLGIEKRQELDGDVIGGFDIGKKVHPSHLAVFQIKKGKRKMAHQKFMDGWDYNSQLEYLKLAIENLGIDKLYYDDTRGEFESFKESGLLPPEMEGVVFTLKEKHGLAAQLDKAVTNKQMELIDDRRMLEQMLMVTNDLDAVETPEGHGDSFWSVALSFKSEENLQPEITIL